MNSDFLVIDDVIPPSFQNRIEQEFFSTTCAWYYNNDVTYGPDAITNSRSPAAFHLLRSEYKTNSPLYSLVECIAHTGALHANYPVKDILQTRAFLQYPLNEKFRGEPIDKLHVDFNIDHLVVLYYVCDSDGDTIIVDKKRDSSRSTDIDKHLRVDDYNILARVTPKKGRCVVFNGNYYHTAQQPENNMRCVINFNVV